jgi:hypothetical protein
MIEKLWHRSESFPAHRAARYHYTSPALGDGWRLVYEVGEIMLMDFRLREVRLLISSNEKPRNPNEMHSTCWDTLTSAPRSFILQRLRFHALPLKSFFQTLGSRPDRVRTCPISAFPGIRRWPKTKRHSIGWVAISCLDAIPHPVSLANTPTTEPTATPRIQFRCRLSWKYS